MKLIRVFPRRTSCTPVDDLAFVGDPPFYAEGDTVHISVAFTWDLPEAERLEKEWRHVAPVTIGGPATGMRGDEFVAGRYMKLGNVITTRGCYRRCWFCQVWRREGKVRELPIAEGWRVHDDNLLACSEHHIRDVFAMLERQAHKAEFASGIEAARLKPWHVELMWKLRPDQIYCAYDTAGDLEPLVEAGKLLRAAGFTTSHHLRAFVLIGYPKDTIADAEKRLRQCYVAGFLPFAMLWRDQEGSEPNHEWKRFSRVWCRPALTRAHLKTIQ